MPLHHIVLIAVAMSLVSAPARGQAGQAPAERVDYLSFAHGAIPVLVGGSGASLGASLEKAIRATDGDPSGFVLTLKPGSASTDVEFVYLLPSATTFDRFAVPNVLETPSPSATFIQRVELLGSSVSATEGFAPLAAATLTTHAARGQVTEMPVRSRTAVRWVKLRLSGGIQSLRPEMYFEFSEIVGNGTQEVVPRSERFTGNWKGRGVSIELHQEGATVTGCYDLSGELTGTVTGPLLRAVGINRSDRVQSSFIMTVNSDGTLLGLRSTNRAPFAIYTGEPSPAGVARCPPPATALGCGAVIHGITFDYDSAVIRGEAEEILQQLFTGLRDAPTGSIVVQGHTSSEGTDQYNLTLSQRRAEAVVADLARRGIARSRLTATGIGEAQPIASNTDESGRSLNRRVEIVCR